MSLIKEFKSFATRGNMVDLAIGIIIGAAFGKIVSSIVNDVIMPPIGLLIHGVKFTDLKLTLKAKELLTDGKVVDAVTLNIGNFVQLIIEFLIIAFTVFLIIKALNKFQKKKEEAPPAPSKEEILLTEIRDILKNK